MDASQGLNDCLEKRDVSLESLDDLAEILQEGDFMAVNDLDSGYWHMALHPPMYGLVGVHFPGFGCGRSSFWVSRTQSICSPISFAQSSNISAPTFLEWDGSSPSPR